MTTHNRNQRVKSYAYAHSQLSPNHYALWPVPSLLLTIGARRGRPASSRFTGWDKRSLFTSRRLFYFVHLQQGANSTHPHGTRMHLPVHSFIATTLKAKGIPSTSFRQSSPLTAQIVLHHNVRSRCRCRCCLQPPRCHLQSVLHPRGREPG